MDDEGWREHPGRLMRKTDVYKLLTNIIYTGQVNHKGTIYPGEHRASWRRRLPEGQ